MTIPKRIHRVWLGGPIPAEFQAYEQVWRDLHPGWQVTTWGEGDLDWLTNRRAFDDAPFLSSKSNIARYEIVCREGGVYVDCDIQPLRPLDELIAGREFIVAEEYPGYYGNAFFAAAPHHPALERAVREVTASHFARPAVDSPGRSGPEFFRRCIRRTTGELGIVPTVLSREAIFPYSYTQPQLRHASFPDSWAVHHWAKSWVEPDRRSAIESVKSVARRSAQGLKKSVEQGRAKWDRLEPRAVEGSSSPSVYLGQGRLLVNTPFGFPVVARTADLITTASLAFDGCPDPNFSAFLERELNIGDVFVHIGAGVGVEVLQAAWTVGITGRTFAHVVEPADHAMLTESLSLNRARGLKAEMQVHLGDRTDLWAALSALAELTLVRLDLDGEELPALICLDELVAAGRIRLLDLPLSDRRAGVSWTALVEHLDRLVERHRPVGFTIATDGARIPLSLAAAVHSDEVEHFLLEFPVAISDL